VPVWRAVASLIQREVAGSVAARIVFGCESSGKAVAEWGEVSARGDAAPRLAALHHFTVRAPPGL
jgi:hypothetical protein